MDLLIINSFVCRYFFFVALAQLPRQSNAATCTHTKVLCINVQDLMGTSSERVCELDFILKSQGLRNFFHESFAKFGLISPEIEIKMWAIFFETLVI